MPKNYVFVMPFLFLKKTDENLVNGSNECCRLSGLTYNHNLGYVLLEGLFDAYNALRNSV